MTPFGDGAQVNARINGIVRKYNGDERTPENLIEEIYIYQDKIVTKEEFMSQTQGGIE